MAKYISGHKKLFDEIAGRGFLNLPGYAYDMENDLELEAKSSLSDINYKILSETIDRELRQAGINYDLAYRNAAVQWEIEKQSLMSAWDQEYAKIRQGMAIEEEIRERLAIEVKKRQTVLIDAKTAIDIEMEGYQKKLAELEDDASVYEVSLAHAKLLTAQKKLELIPILREICTKETELLSQEETKSAELTTLLNAKQEIASKKNDLVPWYAQLATLTETYAGLIPGIISIEEKIAEEKLAQSKAQIGKSQNELQALEIDIDAANVGVETDEAKRSLQEAQFDNKQTLAKLRLENENEYQNEQGGYYDRTMSDERSTGDTILAHKKEINNIVNKTKLTSVTTIDTENTKAEGSMATAEIYGQQQIAEIKKSAVITASLTHLLG